MARVLICSLVLGSLAFAGEPPGAYYKDEAWGFRVRVPRDWQLTAVAADTKWVACKHIGKRKLEWQVGTDWQIEQPEMWVVGFPRDKKGEAANPYDNYKEYITRNSDFFAFGEHYSFAQEKETTVRGTKVTMYEIKLTKKVMGRRVVAWVFHYDDFDFAVQFKILEGRYDDYAASFLGCLKSFRRIKRTKSLEGSAAVGASKIQSRAALAKLPAGERTRAFKDAVETHFKTVTEALPDDWRHKQTKNCLLVTNADSKFVNATVTHVDALVAHLGKFFGETGMEYRPPFILRIFATQDQRRAYGKENEAGKLVRDIAIYSGKGYVKDQSWEDLNQAIWARWIEDRHPKLEKTLPEWLKEGIDKYMSKVRSKGKRITFAHGDWDRDEMRLQIKRNAYQPLLHLMSSGIVDRAVVKYLESEDLERQQRVVVLWLMREGNRGKYKNVIRDLVVNTALAIEAFEEDWHRKNPPGAKAKSDEPQPTSAPVASHRDEIMEDAWQRTFGKWKDKDWAKLTTLWVSFAK